MNIKVSVIGLIATAMLSSAMIANAAPSVKAASKPAVHASKSPVKHVLKRRHAKPSTLVSSRGKLRTVKTAMTKRHPIKMRHLKKVRPAAKPR